MNSVVVEKAANGIEMKLKRDTNDGSGKAKRGKRKEKKEEDTEKRRSKGETGDKTHKKQ